jgi:hypothetical protein
MTAIDTSATISHIINVVNMLPTGLIIVVATGYHGYSILVAALVLLTVLKLRNSHVAVADCRKCKSIHLSGLRWHDIHTHICHNSSNSSSAPRTTCIERVTYLFQYCIELAQNSSKQKMFVKS